MTIETTTDFDGGGAVEITVDARRNHIDLVQADPQGYHSPLFLFRLDDAGGETVSFTVDHEASRMPADHRLVYATDYESLEWARFDESVGGGFERTFERDEVYIAGWQAYPYEHVVDWVAELDAHPCVETTVIGRSWEGRDIHAVRISDPAVPDAEKDAIVSIARQHPGETQGAYHMHAVIDDVLAKFNRDAYAGAYAFHFIPDANPDGISHCSHRFDMQGRDPNRQWTAADPTPEIAAITSYIAGISADIVWAFDMHASTNPTFEAIHYDPRVATSADVHAVGRMADHITSFSGANAVADAGYSTNWFASELDTTCAITEAYTYADYTVSELLTEGYHLIADVNRVVDLTGPDYDRLHGEWIRPTG